MVTGFVSIKAALLLIPWMPNWCSIIISSVLSPLFALLIAEALESIGDAYLERYPEKRSEHTEGRLPLVDWTFTAIPVVCIFGFIVPIVLETRHRKGLAVWEWPHRALWFPLIVAILVGVAWLWNCNIEKKSTAP